MSVRIDHIGGWCPVQAEGTIDGKPFYFRARGRRWSLGIGGEPVGSPEWEVSKQWGDGPYDAGYMPLQDAIDIIKNEAAIYMMSRRRPPHAENLDVP